MNYQSPACESLEGRLLFAASAPNAVDLKIIKVSAPEVPIEVSRHHVAGQFAAARVQNLAASPIKAKFTIQFYLSADRTLDSSDVLVGRAVAHRSLRVGVSTGFIGSLQPDPDLAEGKYYLFVVLKPAAGIINSDPAGNVALATTRVSIVRTHGGRTTDNCADAGSDDYSFCPEATDTTSPASDSSSPDTQPAAESQPTSQAASDGQSSPATQPTTQPSGTQPATDPASVDSPSSVPATDPTSGGDSSSEDSGGGADDTSDF